MSERSPGVPARPLFPPSLPGRDFVQQYCSLLGIERHVLRLSERLSRIESGLRSLDRARQRELLRALWAERYWGYVAEIVDSYQLPARSSTFLDEVRAGLGHVQELLCWAAGHVERLGNPWVIVFDRRPEFLPLTLDLAKTADEYDPHVPVIDVRTHRVGDWLIRPPSDSWSGGKWFQHLRDGRSVVESASARMRFLFIPRPLTPTESDILGRIAVIRERPIRTLRDCVGALVNHVWDEMRRHPGPDGLTPRPVLRSDRRRTRFGTSWTGYTVGRMRSHPADQVMECYLSVAALGGSRPDANSFSTAK